MKKLKNPDIRFLNDMKKVIYDKKWLKTADNLELYYMYRGVNKTKNSKFKVVKTKILILIF